MAQLLATPPDPSQAVDLGSEEGGAALLEAAARLKAAQTPDDKPDDDRKTSEGPDPDEKKLPKAPAEGEESEKKEEGEKLGAGFGALKREQRRMHAEVEEKRAELEAFREEIKEEVQAAKAVAAAAETFLWDPIPVCESLGAKTAQDYHHIATKAYVKYAKLAGIEVPPEWEDKARSGSMEARLRTLETRAPQIERGVDEKLSAREKAAQVAEFRLECKAAALEADEEAAPHVHALMKHAPNDVADALVQIADLRAKQGHKDALEPEELISIYEANLAEELAPFGDLYDRRKKKGSKGATKAPAGTVPKTTSTLSPTVKRSASKERRSHDERMEAGMSHLRRMVQPAAATADDD